MVNLSKEKMVLVMEQFGLTVLVVFKHNNGAKPRLSVNPKFGSDYDEEIIIPKSKLIQGEEKSIKEIEKIMNSNSHFSFSSEDATKIYGVWKRLKSKGVNVSTKMSFNQLISALFEVYKASHWQGNLKDGDLCTEAYIRIHNNQPYFCLPWSEIQDLLDGVNSGWTKKEFREKAGDFCILWKGKDITHWNLYQCPSRHEGWSIRIKMTTSLFSKGDIKKAKTIRENGGMRNE